ncbi:MAG: 4-alpha-glucanotransferase [Eubacteriales bacterium]|nr:4-alpha-glucanotransferase [Eubacteriales bacterium]
MEAYHNSREIAFRSPFGAVELGTEINLKIDTCGDNLTSAVLRIWTEGRGETRLNMKISERPGGHTAETVFKPFDTSLCWYRFELTGSDGNTVYYGTESGRTGGVGRIYDNDGDCSSYQITVSVERKAPDWYKNGIVYQIFPDRFAREAGITQKELSSRLTGHAKGPKRRIVSWDKPVGYDKKKDGSIAAWDFYGGTLNGIREKLQYIRDLGATIIYLNPIFEAASNHRYDTANYMNIDPLLGTEEDFKALCEEADKLGMSVILDGVFNHTGCDSIYFNKYGNYDSIGAYQSEDSVYRDWYKFNPEVPDGYDSWWGVGDLPDIKEDNADYQKFIYGGKDSVVRKWMKLGAKGWRLDVADELPDEFIAGIKKAMLEENADSLLLGEVWEDASNKESYGVKRKYFQGEELDCVMNYPFRDGVYRYITGKIDAEDLCESLYSLLENYPKEAFYSNLNLIGSHDRMRIFSILGDAPDPDALTEEEKRSYKLPEDKRGLAKGRLWLAALMQMTMPGVPCIYYGDEIGVEGYTDPYNRRQFPWDGGDKDCRTIYDNAIGIRRSHRIFTEGDFRPFFSGKDVIGCTRTLGQESVTVLINRSQSEAHTVEIPNLGEFAADLIGGGIYTSGEKTVSVTLNGTGSAIIYFSPKQRLGQQLEPGTGVLCHVTSLPNGGKKGVIGPNVFKFLDQLKKHGEKYWQILPLNPTDFTGSPYAGSSAFAGNLDLVPYSMDELRKQYEVYRLVSGKILPASGYDASGDEFEIFIHENADWIDGYAMFMALKDMYAGKNKQKDKDRRRDKLKERPAEKPEDTSWRSWEDKYRSYSNALWDDKKLADTADFYRYCQYMFSKSWDEIRKYARSLDIRIIGDIPIYVAEDSADAWQYPEMFTLSESESKADGMVAGVPPDNFSPDGQLWGNPLYRWDLMKKDGYSWWMNRFKRAFSLYDIVRLDHFRGFEAYWAVPGGKKSSEGSWKEGPGRDLFEKAYEKFGPLPVIAEDLGFITPGVRSLIITTGFPGMDIMEFYDSDPIYGYTPAADRIAYTGTHDNETLFGWCMGRYKYEVESKVDERLGITAGDGSNAGTKVNVSVNAEAQKIVDAEYEKEYRLLYEKLLKDFYKCPAFIRIVPLQDLLGLDNSARMNKPGTVGENWNWQAPEPIFWNIQKN